MELAFQFKNASKGIKVLYDKIISIWFSLWLFPAFFMVCNIQLTIWQCINSNYSYMKQYSEHAVVTNAHKLWFSQKPKEILKTTNQDQI